MKKKRTKSKKTIPLNTKALGNDISAYPFVEIQWLDIEGDAGWSNTKDLKKEELPKEEFHPKCRFSIFQNIPKKRPAALSPF